MPLEVKGVRELATALGTLPKELQVELREGLKEAADIIAAQAKDNASFSTRIPAAIYTKARLGLHGGAIVGVDSDTAPEARVLELGNVGSRSMTEFRHPVFGDRDVWASEPMHPFLFPALTQKRAAALAVIEARVRDAARLGGLHVT